MVKLHVPNHLSWELTFYILLNVHLNFALSSLPYRISEFNDNWNNHIALYYSTKVSTQNHFGGENIGGLTASHSNQLTQKYKLLVDIWNFDHEPPNSLKLVLCYIIWLALLCFIAIVILIGYMGGHERLHCSHKTLHLSILDPTVFTQITGNITYLGIKLKNL